MGLRQAGVQQYKTQQLPFLAELKATVSLSFHRFAPIFLIIQSKHLSNPAFPQRPPSPSHH